ncbi:unnamed protein product [Adineta ricciae]|uniref:SRCR domain-containing protein n=1 Tax=Adineta ricciae TaxID=249248 RepID=A0A814M6K5_ADIRI|nr:unnamed protein product [Adineta ricciae]CAF1317045.1 unnamed protein product [Adineta ricciae]
MAFQASVLSWILLVTCFQHGYEVMGETIHDEANMHYDVPFKQWPFAIESLGENGTALSTDDHRAALPGCSPIFSLIHAYTVQSYAISSTTPLKVVIDIRSILTGDVFSIEGLVCSSGFSQSTADTMCRMLGHQNNGNIFSNWSVNFVSEKCRSQHHVSKIERSDRCYYMLSGVTCNYGGSNLNSCSFSTSFNNYCPTGLGVRLMCG